MSDQSLIDLIHAKKYVPRAESDHDNDYQMQDSAWDRGYNKAIDDCIEIIKGEASKEGLVRENDHAVASSPANTSEISYNEYEVEQVAKAISVWADGLYRGDWWDKLRGPEKDAYKEQAKLAINAMKPVSVSLEEMLRVFDNAHRVKLGCCKKHRIQAVLDAAGVKYVD